MHGTERVEYRSRLQATGVIGINEGNPDSHVPADNKAAGEREFPGTVAVVLRQIDAEVQIDPAHFGTQGVNEAIAPCNMISHVAQDLILEEIFQKSRLGFVGCLG